MGERRARRLEKVLMNVAINIQLIAAAGLSCREQIKHGTGQVGLHRAEVLRRASKR